MSKTKKPKKPTRRKTRNPAPPRPTAQIIDFERQRCIKRSLDCAHVKALIALEDLQPLLTCFDGSADDSAEDRRDIAASIAELLDALRLLGVAA